MDFGRLELNCGAYRRIGEPTEAWVAPATFSPETVGQAALLVLVEKLGCPDAALHGLDPKHGRFLVVHGALPWQMERKVGCCADLGEVEGRGESAGASPRK